MEDDSPWASPPAPSPPLKPPNALRGDSGDAWSKPAPQEGDASVSHPTDGASSCEEEAAQGVKSLSLVDDDDAWAADDALPTGSGTAQARKQPEAGPFSPRQAVEASPAREASEDNGFELDSDSISRAPVVQEEEIADDDDFDFDEPAGAAPLANPADVADFDDFGDFDDAPVSDGIEMGSGFPDEDLEPPDGAAGFGAGGFVDEPASMPVKPLQLEPLPSRQDLLAQLEALVSTAIFPDPDPAESLTNEPVRQVEGLAQLLQSEASRETYAQLTTPPVFKPLDWTRSRARREHLIALGIPVNLDEVESHGLKPLPPLKITTPRSATHPHRSQSLDTGSSSNGNAQAGPSRSRPSGSQERNGQASNARRKDESSLGLKPEWNKGKSERLLEYREDQLSLVPPKYLQRMQEDLVEACSAASSQLAWLRQVDEIRRDENKRKNDAIGELISRAQRLKASEAANSSGGLFRKGSQKRGASGSGAGTPHRTGSPAMR